MENLRQSMQVEDLREYSGWLRIGQNFSVVEH